MPPLPLPAIRATNLRKSYGAQPVVQDVSFELAAGETLVLLGPSGCGKTTLLKMLNRLIAPDAGTVEINGRDVQAQRPEVLRRGMGYVIQQVGLLPHYTVAENIAVVPKLLGHAPAAIAARTEALLTRLHLPPARYAGQLPQQLSGGQQQRVGLARALAADPPIVLLDEPFGALDPLTRAGIRREFRELDELRRKTVVLVTHDVTEAFELADRILLLDAGRVQQLGTPRELLFRPANDFVRRFFAAERLALQLRVLTLGDVFEALEFRGRTPESQGLTLERQANNPELRAFEAERRANSPELRASGAEGRPNSPELRAFEAERRPNSSEFQGQTPEFQPNNPAGGALEAAGGGRPPEAGLLPADFTPATTVHEALERLTDTASAAAPFTVAQLMAAFGEALQREEDAWKR